MAIKMNPPVQFVATNDGVRIAYSSHGERGQPLVFVRGWMSHLEQMWRDAAVRAYFEPIASHFRLIRFDMRGLGLSDRNVPAIDLAGMVLDVEAVLDQLDLHDVILYGQC